MGARSGGPAGTDAKSVGPAGRPGRASDKKPRHAGLGFNLTLLCNAISRIEWFHVLNADGVASCRFATRPVLCTRPGHPPYSTTIRFRMCCAHQSLRLLVGTAHP